MLDSHMTEQFPGSAAYIRPLHTCQILHQPAPFPVMCPCGAYWGPKDRWHGRTRINEDGTPWKRPAMLTT